MARLLSDSSLQFGTITVSVVSHLQADIAQPLLTDLAKFPEVAKVVYLQNLPEPSFSLPEALSAGRFELLTNTLPQGFGANHNKAFGWCESPYFCVMNPDIRLPENPFPLLLEELEKGRTVLCAPSVRSPDGRVEDSARKFPTPLNLFSKLVGLDDGSYKLEAHAKAFSPDWVGGMFMLLKASVFREVGGFDEGFFLYYEDVDLCVRLRKLGLNVSLDPNAVVVHDARRSSHRSLRYFSWHIRSMMRYFWKHLGRLPRTFPSPSNMPDG